MTAKPNVIVTRRWPETVEKELTERYQVTFNEGDVPFDEARMRDALATADAVLPTVTDKLGSSVFDGLETKARIIGNFGVGFSHIDTDAAKNRDIVVTNTPDVLSECTADIAMTLMLMATRRAGEGERELRDSRWTGWRPTHLVGTKLSGKTLGIIGFGRIGRETARRAHFGFGMSVVVFNRSPVAQETLNEFSAKQLESIEAVLAQSDIVSLHCPGGDANRHLIDAKRLAGMKSRAFLINTARGEVVDEAALVDALKAGVIAGAGLDVFEQEPKVHPGLLKLENAVLLPHLGSATRETREAMGFRVVQNLDDFFAGKAPEDRVA